MSHHRAERNRVIGLRLVLTLVALALGSPAYAVDGVVEINHAKALAGEVTTGDLAGYPVTISEPGSYRLTSDLVVTSGIDGIDIDADNVTVDLNGFTIFGSGEVGLNDGIAVGVQDNTEVRNGTIRGFLRHGIFSLVGTRTRVIDVRAISNFGSGIQLEGIGFVDGCVALDNSLWGIRAGESSLVINSLVRGNNSHGLALSTSAGFRSNIATENNGGNANPQTSGGSEIGTNICGTNTTCP